jgi:glycosyltransferase involved in cell wall biosynthesis
VKIAYLVTRADPIGGAQIHVRDLAAAMQAHGHTPIVITSGQGPFVDSLRANGTRAIVLEHLCGPIAPLRDLRALGEIRAVLNELRPDLLAAHSSKAGILGRLAGRTLNIPTVFTVHGWAFTPGVPPMKASFYRRIERVVGPLSRMIICVSEFDRRLGLDAHITAADRIVTVHNGMPDIAPHLRGDPGRSPARLVMVARHGPQKDHPTLLRALAGLRELEWEIDLIGDGPLMKETEAMAASLGIADRVHFLGQRMDVAEIVARSQVSLLVTNWEGFPLSILEAMRANLPVVASAVGGIEESVRDGETGFLVPRGDVNALRDRIRRLLADASLRRRLGDAGRAYFQERFTLEHFVSKTYEVYQHVLEEVRSPSST